MAATSTSIRRIVVEIGLASAALVGTAVVGLVGAAHWLVIVLPAAHACGGTHRVHPSCRPGAPGAAQLRRWLMTGVPAICVGAGLLVGAPTFARWRHAASGPVVGFAVAPAAFLVGRPMLTAALHDVVLR